MHQKPVPFDLSFIFSFRPLPPTPSDTIRDISNWIKRKTREKMWKMLNDNNKIHQTHLLPLELTLTLLRRLANIPCLVVLFIVSCANFISPRDPLAGIKHLAALFFNSQVAPNKRHLVRLLKIHSHATYRFRLISDASGTWFFSFSLLWLSLRE